MTFNMYFQVVKQQKFHNRHKIVPVKSERRIHMMDFFYYASVYLLNRPVIALNGDIGNYYQGVCYQPPTHSIILITLLSLQHIVMGNMLFIHV